MSNTDTEISKISESTSENEKSDSKTTVNQKFRYWLKGNHNHVYGAMGIIGVLLALMVPFIKPNPNGDEHLEVDLDTRERIENTVREYRETSTDLPQIKPSESRIYVDDADAMPATDNSGFRITKHEVVVDFNNFDNLKPIDLPIQKSAVIQHVTHQIKKITEADKFSAVASTSGLDVFFQSHSPIEVYANDDKGTFGLYTVKRRVAEFDVSEYPVGSRFIVQHRKTYWNAFQGPDQSWAGYETRVATDEIEYLIIFPEDKPFKSIEFFANNSDGTRRRLNRESYVLQDDNKTWLWWRAIRPEPGISYNIDWDW